ncbi:MULTISPECIES: pseudouridine synthase [Sphingobacterium]|uniref:Pseudouridine synthase n=1 Tax=Sphingobacterium litopenaei TaxID=2763500 RepID=A0ABR7YII2_9SPHI|nr:MULTISPECIES: pseudouridine synthase [Sphingobacterium]MBD1431127.1 rRNA pseudouridine synthase [Sphingobacterium litopenaei]NGM74764.1 rRNA pseudouridine synthase [Sphingobacterium sp. SGL-16]
MPFKSQRNSREDNSRKSRSNSESFRSKDNSNKKFGNKSESFGKSSFSKDRKEDNKSFGKSSFSKFNKEDKKSFGRSSYYKSSDRDDNKSYGKSFSKDGSDRRSSFNKPFNKEGGNERKSFDRKTFGKSFDKEGGSERRSFDKKPFKKSFEKEGYTKNRRPEPTSEYQEQREKNDFKYSANRKFRPANKPANKEAADDGLIRLNRYISNAGICSRRKADELITAGVVSVNGEVVTSLGTKVDPAKDEIRYNNERLKREKMVYVLLNKPKDYITTTDDPQERRTVMQLVAKATKERIYPVGRLDRNTTGLLLLTNDGNLAEKLSHPRNNVTKIYQVELNKNLTQGDFNKIQFGIELEDGLIKPDDLSYVAGASKREVGIQIHSGKNRIVRRIFESLGYEVIKLDRVVYANLTKKDLPRGRWRYLEEKELIQLKHFVK